MKRSATGRPASLSMAGHGRSAAARIPPSVTQELERLRRENDRLQIERDTLVKAVNWLSSRLHDRQAPGPSLDTVPPAGR